MCKLWIGVKRREAETMQGQRRRGRAAESGDGQRVQGHRKREKVPRGVSADTPSDHSDGEAD